MGPVAALASYWNSSYEGVYSSSAPRDYEAAPAGTLVGTTVTYTFDVTNNGAVPAGAPGGSLYVQRITAIDGQSVAAGNASFSEADAADHATAADPAQVVAPLDQSGILFDMTQTQSYQFTPAQCGYWVIWTGSTANRTDQADILNQGAIRVTGCTTSTASPTYTPTPRRTGGTRLRVAHPAATASPSPTATPSPAASPSATARSRRDAALPVGSVDPGDGGPGPVGLLVDSHGPLGISGGNLAIGAGALLLAGLGGAAWVLRERLRLRDRLRRLGV